MSTSLLNRDPRSKPAIIGSAEPHRGDLAATRPASPGRAGPAGGVEPDGRGHSLRLDPGFAYHEIGEPRFNPNRSRPTGGEHHRAAVVCAVLNRRYTACQAPPLPERGQGNTDKWALRGVLSEERMLHEEHGL
jgi:hypothetical protein